MKFSVVDIITDTTALQHFKHPAEIKTFAGGSRTSGKWDRLIHEADFW